MSPYRLNGRCFERSDPRHERTFSLGACDGACDDPSMRTRKASRLVHAALEEVRFALAASASPVVRRTEDAVGGLLDASDPVRALEMLVSRLNEGHIAVLPSTKLMLRDAAHLIHAQDTLIEDLATHSGDGSVAWESQDRWLLGWRGSLIRLVSSTSESATAAIGMAGRLTIVGQVWLAKRAGSQLGHLVNPDAALAPLAGRAVASAVAFKSGQLRLIVDTGAMVNVRPDLQSSRWSATTDEGLVIKSTAGGGITVQPPAP